MDFYAYVTGWSSGFLAGFALGGLVVHAVTLLYWHFYIRNSIVDFTSKLKNAPDGGEGNDLLFQGIASALPHLMRKGRGQPPAE